jgi:pimeloyl-ACP methyl ester carboxylesterase
MKKTKQNLDIHYIKIGNKQIEFIVSNSHRKAEKDVIFLHGLNSDCRFWQKTMLAISPEYRCWAISLPKYGEHKIEDYSKFVKYFMDKNGLKTPFFVGHSFGGLIGLFLTSQGVKFEKMLLVSTPVFLKPPELTRLLISCWGNLIVKSNIARIFFRSLLAKLEACRKLLENAPIESYFECYTDVINLKIPLDFQKLQVKRPLAVIYGRHDIFLKIINGTFFYQLKPTRTIALNAGHFIPSDHPTELAYIINDFFESSSERINE